MICSNCGKEIAAENKFCPNCGTAIAVQSVPSEKLSESPTIKAETSTDDQGNDTINSGTNTTFKFERSKLIPSFIFGVILSIVTTFLMDVSVVRTALVLGAWIITGAFAYLIVQAITQNKVFAYLGAVIGALLLGSFLVGIYHSAVNAADTMFGVILIIAVVAIVYTPIIYIFASAKNATPNNDDQNTSDNNTK